MKREKDNLDPGLKGVFRTPEGYFDSLRTRLDAIPSLQEAPVVQPVRSLRERVLPYLALAASFAVLLVVGTLILKQTVPPATETGNSDSIGIEIFSADMIPVTNPYAVFMEEPEPDPFPEDGIIAYLIASGTPLQLVAMVSSDE